MLRLRGKKGGGNRYIFISILLILIILYVYKIIAPQSTGEYPELINYDSKSYTYVETVKGLPITFIRQKKTSKEGYLILGRRGVSTADEVYIYEGYRKYRRYKAQTQ